MWEADRSGRGQVVDAAMVDGTAVLTTMLHGMIAQGRWRDEAGVNFGDTGSPYYDTYQCADGRHFAVGAIEPSFYAELLQGLGLDPIGLPDRRDQSTWPVLKAIFAEAFGSRTRDEWAKVFDHSDACAAPVLSLTEAPRHPHNVARSTFLSTAASCNRHRPPDSAVRSLGSTGRRRPPVTTLKRCWPNSATTRATSSTCSLPGQ